MTFSCLVRESLGSSSKDLFATPLNLKMYLSTILLTFSLTSAASAAVAHDSIDLRVRDDVTAHSPPHARLLRRGKATSRLGGAEKERMDWVREGSVPLHSLRTGTDYDKVNKVCGS